MANSKSSDTFHEYATVDTSPGAAGYGTNEISLRELKTKLKKIADRVYFSIRESESDSSGASDTSNITVNLQFKCAGDAGWQDYKLLNGQTILTGHRFAITDMGAEVRWRGWVKDNDFNGGKVTFGFDW
jgi:hypothetical protein